MAHATTKAVDLTFETPALHRDAVVIVGDAHFYKCGLLLARQLLEKEKNRTFDICVICSEEVETPPLLAEGLRIGSVRFVRTDHLKIDDRITVEAYVPIYLPGEMSGYQRLCYLDADIYLNRPGVQDLINVDMEKQPLAAVPDIIVWGDRLPLTRSKRYREKIAQAPDQYFNTGMLLIDVEEFNLALPPENISGLIAERASHLRFHDQTFLNMEFSHRVKLLSPIWNFPMVSGLADLCSQADPVLLHFMGIKPWFDTVDEISQEYHPEYREFLSKFFNQTDFSLKKGATLPRLSYRKYRNPLREIISRKKIEMSIKRKKRRYPQLLAEAMGRYPVK